MKGINIILAASNLFAVFVVAQLEGFEEHLIRFAMMASVWMHLSETKHGLIGIYPLNQHANFFLWLDRIAALITGCYLLTQTVFDYHTINMTLTGLFLMFVSEKIVIWDRLIVNQVWFAVFHLLWHAVAYYLIWWILIGYSQYHCVIKEPITFEGFYVL